MTSSGFGIVSNALGGNAFTYQQKRQVLLDSAYPLVDVLTDGMLHGRVCGERIPVYKNDLMEAYVSITASLGNKQVTIGPSNTSDFLIPYNIPLGLACRSIKRVSYEYDIDLPARANAPSLTNNNITSILSLEVVNTTVANLANPIIVSLPLNPADYLLSSNELYCAYRENHLDDWKTDSSCVVTGVTDDSIVLSTSHLTYFTVFTRSMTQPWGTLTHFFYTTVYNPNWSQSDIANALGKALGVDPWRFFINGITRSGNDMRIDIIITDPYQNTGLTSQQLLENLVNMVGSNPAALSAVGLPPTAHLLIDTVSTTGVPAFIKFSPVVVTTESAGLFIVSWNMPDYTSYCAALNMTFNSWRIESDQRMICRDAPDLQHFAECVALPGTLLNVTVTYVCNPLESAGLSSLPYYVTSLRADAPSSMSVSATSGTVSVSWVPGKYTCDSASSTFASWQFSVTTNNATLSYYQNTYTPYTFALPGGILPGYQSQISIVQVCTAVSKSSLPISTFYAPGGGNIVYPPIAAQATIDPTTLGKINIVVTTNALSSCSFVNSTFSGYNVSQSLLNNMGGVVSRSTSACQTVRDSYVICQVSAGNSYRFSLSVICSGNNKILQSAPVDTNIVTLPAANMRVASLDDIFLNPDIFSVVPRGVSLVLGSAFNGTGVTGMAFGFVELSDTPSVPGMNSDVDLAFELTAISSTAPVASAQYGSPILLVFSYAGYNITDQTAAALVLFYYDATLGNYTSSTSSCPPSARVNNVDTFKKTWTTTTCHLTTFRAFTPSLSNGGGSILTPATENKSSGLAGGSIAAIVLGIILLIVLIILLVLIILYCKSKQNKNDDGLFEPNSANTPARSKGLFESNSDAGIANMTETLRPVPGTRSAPSSAAPSPNINKRGLFEPNYVAGVPNLAQTMHKPLPTIPGSPGARESAGLFESNKKAGVTNLPETIRPLSTEEEEEKPKKVKANKRGSDLIDLHD